MNKIWFTSDTHFNHFNILKYCDRPFKDVSEMNEAIIRNHNSLVDSNDTVYHLGDFGFGSAEDLYKIRQRLNGQICFINGNHDRQFLSKMFGWRKDYYELKVDDIMVVLCHYPMLTWNKQHRGSIQLSGHTHSKTKLVRPDYRGINVGVDAFDFRPVSWDTIKSIANSVDLKDYRSRSKEN